MKAAMALHVALSMRLDAIEAYRLARAYRDEELQKFADRLASRATLYGDSNTVIEIIRDLRRLAGVAGGAEIEATSPDFFQPGHVYTREHHGRRIEFHVVRITTAPDCDFPTAFGWRKDPEMPCHLPMDSDDLDGWTDITEAGAA